MKVKDILEVLAVKKISEEMLISMLDNVGITANLETDIPQDVVKKLGKRFGMDIKPVKVKKETPKKEEPKQEIKVEEKKEEPKPVVKVEEKKEEPKPEKVKKETPKKETVVETKPEEKPKTETPRVEVEVELTRVYDDTYTDYDVEAKVYNRIRNIKKTKQGRNVGSRQKNVGVSKNKTNVLTYVPGMSVAQVADALGISIGEIVKKLVMLGNMLGANEVIDRDLVEILADDAGYKVEDKVIEDITKFEEIQIKDDEKDLVPRPAIVTIMGHVDHGKTTLLDTIRNSHVVTGEAGGITQHIGAYQVEKGGRIITFIDTPGHAAFTEMRARGAEVTDIVILVVAADDGVMPQTKEAIDHSKVAGVPIIVAINKIDKPGVNPDRIKQELSNYGLVAEEWGGKTIFVPISALTGKGVDDLLEMVLLTSDILELKANPNRLGVGTVIEARLDKGRGPVATLLVKNGTVKIGDPIVVGNTWGKIRAMQDENKLTIRNALPSKAVEVTGLDDVPQAGDHFMVFEDEKTARLVAGERSMRAFNIEKGVGQKVALASLFDEMDDSAKELNLIIKGDVQGSIEALKGSLEKLTNDKVKINIVRSSVGTITETDITLAIASKAIIIGFNIRPTAKLVELAKERGVEIRLYNIIYKVLEDIEDAMKGMLDPVFEEEVLGQAEVRSIFKASKIGTIAGCYVTSGLIMRNAKIRLIRDSISIYDGTIAGLKRFKDDVKEVKSGYECGVTIENYNDIKEGDIIEAYQMVKVK